MYLCLCVLESIVLHMIEFLLMAINRHFSVTIFPVSAIIITTIIMIIVVVSSRSNSIHFMLFCLLYFTFLTYYLYLLTVILIVVGYCENWVTCNVNLISLCVIFGCWPEQYSYGDQLILYDLS